MQPNLVTLFLSHSGLDAALSVSIQRQLEHELNIRGLRVKVFNTSTVADRFKELQLLAGADWRSEDTKYQKELQEYLQTNLRDSAAYVLLVTPQSLAAHSEWIRF